MTERAEPATLASGDLCQHGENRIPSYRVIHIHEDRAWIRDSNTGVDSVTPVEQCSRIAEQIEDGPDAPPLPTPADAGIDRVVGPTGPTWPNGSPRP